MVLQSYWPGGLNLKWWRHQMETFSASLAICAGNSPVPGELPAQRPVTRSFDVFFDLRLNKWLSKQSWDWWFETLLRPLWRHCNKTGLKCKVVTLECCLSCQQRSGFLVSGDGTEPYVPSDNTCDVSSLKKTMEHTANAFKMMMAVNNDSHLVVVFKSMFFSENRRFN